MLLFKRDAIAPILAGTKTQTRRWGPRQARVGSKHDARTNMAKASTFARLHIIDVRRERVQDITPDDVRAEGFETKAAFLQAWRDVGGKPSDDCWVLTFEVVADESRP